jgi:hypothetical protein
MFANTQAMGSDIGTPDVCNTPNGSGVDIPTPYANTAQGSMGAPAVYTVLMSGTPVHNLNTTVSQTNGDEAGVDTGLASGTVMGP